MNPLLRIWAISATCVALLLAIRGAVALAIVCFVCSPAPVWLFAPRHVDQHRLSRSWLGVVAVAVVVLFGLALVAAYTGGVPQVHEWRAAIRGGAD